MNIYAEWTLRSILLLLGSFGNLMGLVVLSGKRLEKFPPRKIFISLAIIDTTFLTYTILSSINLDKLVILSVFSCKFFSFIPYFLPPISSHLLVFISIHRFVTIQFKAIAIINKSFFQVGIIIGIMAYNMAIYSPILIFISLVERKSRNSSNRTIKAKTQCLYSSHDIDGIISR